MKWKPLLGLAALAAGAAGYGYMQWKAPATATADATEQTVAAPAVTVAKVATANFVETAIVSGSIIPREEILVSPEIEGLRVMELFADEGDVVKKGQILARLVTEQLDAQMAQNEAGLSRSSAAIAQAQSQIAQAEAQAKEAQAQLDRAEPLKKSGYLSGATYDQRESAMRTTQAQVVAARDGLKAAEAEKGQVEAQRRELAWRRSNTEVKAPEDGIISRRMARIGATASAAGEPMFRIIENGEIELDAEVVETELQRVKVGQKALVTVTGAPDAEGTVRLVSPEVDKTTRLGRVKVFLGTNPALRVGGFARGRIETASSRGLAVPASAVMFDQTTAYVQVVNGMKVQRKAIKTGLISGDLVEVRQGLSDGDLIVARAGTFLRDGDSVRPIVPDPKVSEAK
jgi:HlyD family secretion protein